MHQVTRESKAVREAVVKESIRRVILFEDQLCPTPPQPRSGTLALMSTDPKDVRSVYSVHDRPRK